MSAPSVGRHRASTRLNPVANLSSAMVRGARPALASAATVAATSGMVTATAPAAEAVAVGQNAPAAETVVLAGTTTTQVTYGAPVVKAAGAQAATAPTFAPIALSNRVQVQPVRETAEAAPGAAAGATGGRAAAIADYAPAQAPSVSVAAAPAPAPKPAATVNPAPSAGVLGIAASLSGIPYVWGGTSTSGFDCSGFTQYVFGQAGISLPRTAGAQRAATTYVSNPQPGDLVFFGTYHVGIYAGNGMMYDAPTSGQFTGLHRIWSSDVTYGRP